MNVAMAQLGKTRTTYAIRFSSARDRVSLGRGALGLFLLRIMSGS
jgi:hypothetical protein